MQTVRALHIGRYPCDDCKRVLRRGNPLFGAEMGFKKKKKKFDYRPIFLTQAPMFIVDRFVRMPGVLVSLK